MIIDDISRSEGPLAMRIAKLIAKTRLAYSVTLMRVKRPLGRLMRASEEKEAARKAYNMNSKYK